MNFPRASLIVTGLLLLGLGLAFLLDPAKMGAVVGLLAQDPRPSVEVRAMYGGLEIGLGLFFLVAASRIRWIRAALAAQTLMFLGLASGRVVGLVLSNPSDRRMVALVWVELAGAVVGALAFRHAKRALRALADRREYD